jgi:hypothetical protein
LLIGWIHWHDNKPTDYQMGRVAEGFVPPKRSELGDFDQMDWERDEQSGQMRDPWQLSNSMLLMDAATRQLYTFATASKGGIGAVAKLLAIYGKHVRQVPDALPVVALLSDSYRHPNKAYGKIFTPLFKVTDWVHRGEFDAVLEEDSGAAIEASEAEEEEEEQAAILPAEKASPSPKVAVKAPVKEAGKAPLKGASKQRKAGQDNISF